MDEEEENEHPAAHWRGADAGGGDAGSVFRRPIPVRGNHHREPVGSVWMGRDPVVRRYEPVPVGGEVMKYPYDRKSPKRMAVLKGQTQMFKASIPHSGYICQ